MAYVRALLAVTFLACVSPSAMPAETIRPGVPYLDAEPAAAALLSSALGLHSSAGPRSYSPLQKVRACGSSGYSCDDIAFPACLWDSSEESYYCAPDDVTYCEYADGWDYWCSLDEYCCGDQQCCQ